MNITLLIIIIYLFLTFVIAWYFSRKESLEDYFLNKKKTNLWLMTFSTVATVFGAGASVAIVSEVYNSGISYGLALPVSFLFGMLILGLAAKKIKSIGDEYGAYTVVDFFHKRYDKKNKILVGILQLFLLIIWIAVQAVAIASLVSVLIGVDYTIALILTAVITICYTSLGGLKVDIITDFFQFWIIMIVFVALAFIGYQEVGGFSNLISNVPKEHFNPFAFGGISWFIGAILLSGFLYLGNTTQWQRIFSAESQQTAKKSFYLSIPFLVVLGLITIFLGLISSVLLSGIKQENAIFLLMNELLTPTFAGIGFAAILAVIMSSIDSLLVGGSAIIYKAMFKENGSIEKRRLLYARIITTLFGILGFVIAFILPNIITLSLLVTYLAIIFVPPIISGLYYKKTSSEASFWSILIPTIVLFSLFPFVKENTFLISGTLGIVIIIFYDKLFKVKL